MDLLTLGAEELDITLDEEQEEELAVEDKLLMELEQGIVEIEADTEQAEVGDTGQEERMLMLGWTKHVERLGCSRYCTPTGVGAGR